jgi:sugar phosphate isomerase/epimerase
MKLAFSKPTGTDEDTRLLLTRFREAGYDGLQLKAGQYVPYLDEPERFLADWGDHRGAASALITGETGVGALRRLFAFGKTVGTERVVLCLGLPRDDFKADRLRRMAAMVSLLGLEAQDYGLKLSLHHHYDHPVMLPEEMEVFFGAVEPESVGLTVDTAHLVKSGVDDVAGVIRRFAPVIDNFHLKDYADGEWRVLGTGDIDFAPIFAAIRNIGYDGWLSTDEESGADVHEAMAACHAFVKQGLSLSE